MKCAILGPGGIADDQHAPAVSAHPTATNWSVLSRSVERGRDFAERHGLQAPEPVHTSLESLLADPDLEGVIIATPDRLHEQQAVAAARAGKHILLEKPMATSSEACDRITRACLENEVVLAMAYHHRWHDGHRSLQKRVAAGLLGQLRHMRVHWTFQAPHAGNWRSFPDTGRWWSLAANGTHCLDLIRWFFLPTEGEISHVASIISRAKFDSPHDESAVVAIQFESGATAEICVSVQYESEPRVEIYGDNGWIRMENTLGRHGGGQIQYNGEPVSFQQMNPFLGELDDWIRAIHERRPPEVPGEEGQKNVAWLLKAIQASGEDSYTSK
jgi:1,5-anhydro-D-fructose reductase (1,5-anhydro-D-mannitol-forming)